MIDANDLVLMKHRTVPGGAVAWRAFLGLIGAVTVVYFFLSTGVQSIVYDAVGVSAAVAMLAGIGWNHPGRRPAWMLLAFGILASSAGDIVFGTSAPVPSPADMFYVSAYSLLALGLLGLAKDPDGHHTRSALTDAVVIAVGVGILSIVFLLAPAGHARETSTITRAVALGYPVMDVGLLALLVRAGRSGMWSRAPLWLLGVALVLRFVADLGYALQGFGTAYTLGGGVDGAFLLAYAFFGAAPLHPALGRIARVANRATRARRFTTPDEPGTRDPGTSVVGERVGSRGAVVVVGDRGPTIVAVRSSSTARVRGAMSIAGIMLLGLATLALFLALAWHTPEVMMLAGAYGTIGSLSMIASAFGA